MRRFIPTHCVVKLYTTASPAEVCFSVLCFKAGVEEKRDIVDTSVENSRTTDASADVGCGVPFRCTAWEGVCVSRGTMC